MKVFLNATKKEETQKKENHSVPIVEKRSNIINFVISLFNRLKSMN